MSETQTIELLAPAGNLECLHAAVTAGADAVYLGLDEFNARRNAGNFTLDNLPGACDYAHLRGVSVYVTMNIEILDSELDRALQSIARAYEAGADAFIVQDIGLAARMRQQMPNIPLHVSTQMNIHNAAGIESAALLGAQRVTLARELSLTEIAELSAVADGFGMQVECFAHGALCICYSGQCLMSSLIGGRSANRGLCAQACRLPYELRCGDTTLPASGEHLLSPRDLCAVDLIGDLRKAGVASLKIEGRMKSADYVHEVVRVYREVIDSGQKATEEQRARLEEAFSRGFTTAYLEGKRGNDIMSYGRPNNRGVFAGRVTAVDGGTAHLKPEIELHGGDVVEFWTNKGHFAAEVPADTPAGGNAAIPVTQRTQKGDRVFRVRNAAAMFADDEFEPRIPLTGHATLRQGQPLHIEFRTADGTFAEAWGDVVEAARTKPVGEDDVRAHIDRLGQTPFTLERLSVDLGENVGIGFSQLHHVRADALDRLKAEILAPYVRAEQAAAPKNAPANQQRFAARQQSGIQVCAWATNPGCARAAKRAGADALYVPILNFKRSQAQLMGERQAQAEQAGYPKQCVMALPAIDHDPVEGARESVTTYDLWDYVREGKPVFADSLAGITRAMQTGADVEAGPHVPATNAATLEYLANLGVKRVWLSPELTLSQLAELAEHSPVDLGLFVSGQQELMITEHCLLMSQGACNERCETCPRRETAHHLVDRKGFEFPVVTDMMGRSHLYNGIELDATGALLDLIDMGITAFMVDTTFMDKKTAELAVSRVMRARELAIEQHRGVDKRPGTTTGHLFRGVQ